MQKENIGTRIFPEHYEGWLQPRTGPTPYKILDDPEIIAKKNRMREALREEYHRKLYNPYRMASGVGGGPVDPMIIRYNAMLRTQEQYFRPGPKVTFSLFMLLFAFPIALYNIVEGNRGVREDKYRSGLVAYKDRPLKWAN